MKRLFRSRAVGQTMSRALEARDAGDEHEGGRAAPRMTRSVGQLAGSYAPERHFAFESGLGVCISRPEPSSPLAPPEGTKQQIRARLMEATNAWFKQGEAFLESQSDDRARALRPLLVDPSLYDDANNRFDFRVDVFDFVSPTTMGYEPSPTTLACGTCGLLRPCRSTDDMLGHLREAETRCHDPKTPHRRAHECEWRQFEPICVHPSGNWSPLGTDVVDIDGAGNIYTRRAACESCGSNQFRVDTKKVALSGWFLRCAKCDIKYNQPWTNHDKDYLPKLNLSGVTLADARMEKISYGAAVAHNVQSETFVDLPDADALKMLDANRVDELQKFVARQCGYLGAPPSAAEALDELRRRGEAAQRIAERIAGNLQSIEEIGSETPTAERLSRQIAADIEEARERGLLTVAVELPASLLTKARDRTALWASRYDPFRLAAEHEALSRTKLSGALEGSRASFVRFTKPDERLSPWRTKDEEDRCGPFVETALKSLGIAEAGLVPKFEICRFTYGYSRTSSSPVPQHGGQTPVRLKLFPKTRVGDEHVHPIYVLRQSNEAFYFKLDKERVAAWLDSLACVDGSFLRSEPSLAGALFMSAHPMGRFLDEHDRAARSNPHPSPSLYAATYGLLHSMAHHVMRTMARLSGLDEGGLGEYLFPTDLAFVVYRSGMTMDLGDLSSLWRNSWEPFLNDLRNYNVSLGCNVGSLCGEQGGACPDCLMIPEVSCVAGNKYLSRSLLTGEGRPAFMDFPPGRPQGFLKSPRRSGD